MSTAYHNGTATSIAAARQIAGSAATLRRQVLAFIVECGLDGATDEAIQHALGMAGNTARPRRLELVESGHVEDLGERRFTSSGRKAVVWHATVKGRMAIQETP